MAQSCPVPAGRGSWRGGRRGVAGPRPRGGALVCPPDGHRLRRLRGPAGLGGCTDRMAVLDHRVPPVRRLAATDCRKRHRHHRLHPARRRPAWSPGLRHDPRPAPLSCPYIAPGRKELIMTTVHTQPVPAPPSAPLARGRHALDLRSHRNLGGPYTAGSELLRRVVPELMSMDPGLVKPASTAVVAITPDLEGDVPRRPQTLTDLARGEERTRFYPAQRT